MLFDFQILLFFVALFYFWYTFGTLHLGLFQLYILMKCLNLTSNTLIEAAVAIVIICFATTPFPI